MNRVIFCLIYAIFHLRDPCWHVEAIIHTVLFTTKIIPLNGQCFASSPLKSTALVTPVALKALRVLNKSPRIPSLRNLAEPWANLVAASSFTSLITVILPG